MVIYVLRATEEPGRRPEGLGTMAEDTTGILAGLRPARDCAGVSQLDLARDAGVGYRTVQNAEAGRIVSSRTLVKLANALDVPAAVLLEDER